MTENFFGIPTTDDALFENFSEAGYLEANPDVAVAVREKRIESGRWHFDAIGHTEGRKLIRQDKIAASKQAKIAKISGFIAWDYAPPLLPTGAINCLPDYLAEMAGVEHTDAISQHDYTPDVKELIENNPGKLFLDAGAGFRPIYYPNVVNLEIVPYSTTDVLGVLEKIPFRDGTFDYVVSNAVLEHVRDPFTSAKEITRVLKRGGKMFIQVPFLQPYHGYPHHYYNMTKSGLANLFKDDISIDSHTVPFYFHPVWVASWFFNSWANGLSAQTRHQLESLTVKELMNFRVQDMRLPFVAELDENKQFELASGTYLIGTKN
ncbi:class I SAM-dependent methyltransferase [Brucella intermedia]|uniref:class I SAM-dependent methyltransferase n=1 Tax=Brucella intermedia TaxID=94625 RepID=UPI001590CFF1|nr:class I SAM-dependent methyltransferase [Brucella intermedia]